MEKFISELVIRNETVLVAYSGGKDSTFVLKYLSERGVNLIAYLIDNSFLSRLTIENALNISKSLNIRLIIDVPPIKNIRDNFKKAIDGYFFTDAQVSRASDICNVCMFYINRSIIDFALNNNIKYISGGYLPGQIPSASYLSKIPLQMYFDMSEKINRDFCFHNISNRDMYKGFIYSFNPMVNLVKKEEDILAEIKTIGWKKPKDSGLNSSNCIINDYAIKKHIEKYGINPYEIEIIEQIKNGMITKEEADKRLNYDYSQVAELL